MDFNKIRTEKEFLKKLNSSVLIFNQNQKEFYHSTEFEGEGSSSEGRVEIYSETFNDQYWVNFTFNFFEFKNCKFINIKFNSSNFWGCNFIDCTFTDSKFSQCSIHETDFVGCKINKSRIEKSTFGDSGFYGTTFFNCHEIYDTYFGSCNYKEVDFRSCQISFCRFEAMIVRDEKSINFSLSKIDGTAFNSFDLTKSKFISCIHTRNIYSNTSISKNTFSGNNTTENSEYSTIDLHSLSNSEELNVTTLQGIFGIKEPDIKTYAIGMTQDIKLHSVFISYSFKDQQFANLLNDSLKRKGVFTFLWEKNAPGGKRLKTIMADTINAFDRILFIASENSIKSEACQYELTQARLKQDKLWKTIFIPIHIDNYLFQLQKDEIRPIEKREEYWKNIEDLKEINSLDFRDFNNLDLFDEQVFEEMIYKLISVLKGN